MSTADFSRARWRKSSRSSEAGNCVEVARAGHAVGVRDSKHTAGPHLVFTTAAWTGFLHRP